MTKAEREAAYAQRRLAEQRDDAMQENARLREREAEARELIEELITDVLLPRPLCKRIEAWLGYAPEEEIADGAPQAGCVVLDKERHNA